MQDCMYIGLYMPARKKGQKHTLCTQDFKFCVPLCARIMACEPPAKQRRLKSSGLHGGDCTLKKEETGSGLRMWLLEQFAWGHLSTMHIQKIAELAVLDARSSRIKDLDEIGQAGTAGRHATRPSRP